jgi:dihydropteroate synthase
LPAIIHSKGRELDVSSPVVMGILNATPDSFYSKGHGSDPDALLSIVEKMLKDGVAIIDIGGASTKPGQELIGADEELGRVIPVITAIHKRFPELWLSVDTYNARVATDAVAAGVAIVNDVSSGRFDAGMLQAVAALQVPYIAMHMQGTPATMQVQPEYNDTVAEVYDYLQGVCDQCAAAGIAEVIVDPGFGFGKTVEHNFELLGGLRRFQELGRPVLAGLSRKSMICKPLKVNPEHALNGTTALNMVALQQGANILRVHDVREAMEVIKLYRLLKSEAL